MNLELLNELTYTQDLTKWRPTGGMGNSISYLAIARYGS